jgi:hypothetical protein
MRFQRHLSAPARRTWERAVARARVDEVNVYAVACAPRFIDAYETTHDGHQVTMFVEPVDRQVRANGFLTRERIVETATGVVLGVRAVEYADIAHSDRALVAHGLHRAPVARRTASRSRGAGRPRRRAGASSRTSSADPGDSDPASPAASADRSSALAPALNASRLSARPADVLRRMEVGR